MPRTVIDAVRDKLFSKMSSDAAPTIVWHAGEPTVVPLAWYKYAYAELRTVAPAAAVFSIQSNGIALPEAWLEFLRETQTRIGLSIDGPQRFHDARRKTRAGGGTWSMTMKTLRRLQSSGFDPGVISVLHPQCLSAADEFYEFYRDNRITQVSFSIDEAEGANLTSSFANHDQKSAMVSFLLRILNRAFAEQYPLHIKEIERISLELVGAAGEHNEQVEAWQVVVVGANGDVTSFSPELMEIHSPTYNNFCFGNILDDDFDRLTENLFFKSAQTEISRGVELCRASCRYFAVCGGGAPVNKMCENKSFASSETAFCRLSVQAAADALMQFLLEKAGVGPEDLRRSTPCTDPLRLSAIGMSSESHPKNLAASFSQRDRIPARSGQLTVGQSATV
jgi:uncharacterized protein